MISAVASENELGMWRPVSPQPEPPANTSAGLSKTGREVSLTDKAGPAIRVSV